MLSWEFSHSLTDFGEYLYSARVPFVKWQFTTSFVAKGFDEELPGQYVCKSLHTPKAISEGLCLSP